MIRLDSYISKNGVCSRRKVKDLLKAGKILLNNQVVYDVTQIDPKKDVVSINGKIIDNKRNDFVYILLNKPLYVLSTTKDEFGRKTVLDIVKSKKRLYPVGRLDFNTTGLLILTNDGDFALKMTHPRYHVSKKYVVTTKEVITPSHIQKLESGIMIEGKKTMPANVRKIDTHIFEIELFQGINKQVRKMCENIGLTVVSLKRISFGDLKLYKLKEGEYRKLSSSEVNSLYALIDTKSKN